MSINFPTSLDSLTNPTASDSLNSPSHSTQHANANDILEALEAKVGVNSSDVATTLDYLLKNVASVNPGHKHTILYPASDSTTAVQINKADGTTNVFNVDTTNGRVGIGTTAPGCKLTVWGDKIQIGRTGDSDLIQFVNSNNTLEYGRIRTVGTSKFGIIAISRDFRLETNNGILSFWTGTGTATEKMIIQGNGNVGIGVNPSTAVLHLKAGTATASTAPLKFTSGTVLTTPEAGAVEFDGTDYFITI